MRADSGVAERIWGTVRHGGVGAPALKPKSQRPCGVSPAKDEAQGQFSFAAPSLLRLRYDGTYFVGVDALYVVGVHSRRHIVVCLGAQHRRVRVRHGANERSVQSGVGPATYGRAVDVVAHNDRGAGSPVQGNRVLNRRIYRQCQTVPILYGCRVAPHPSRVLAYWAEKLINGAPLAVHQLSQEVLSNRRTGAYCRFAAAQRMFGFH